MTSCTPLRRATVYVDASFIPETGAGGWAMWLRAPGRRYVAYRHLPVEQMAKYAASGRGATAAEAAGILFSVLKARELGYDSLIVKSDAQTVVKWLSAEAPPRRTWSRPIYDRYRALTAGMDVRLAWVRGHREGLGSEPYINRQVDAYARTATEIAGINYPVVVTDSKWTEP